MPQAPVEVVMVDTANTKRFTRGVARSTPLWAVLSCLGEQAASMEYRSKRLDLHHGGRGALVTARSPVSPRAAPATPGGLESQGL